MQTLDAFLRSTEVVIECRPVRINGEVSVITEPWAVQHYSCELYSPTGDRPVKAIIGSDNGQPELREVLDTVAAEAAVIEQAQRYEEWAHVMGFDPDSRRGERIYRSARRQARLLRQLLGEHRYRTLLWETERL